MNTSTSESPWFETWFDTEYYHILYSNRDEQEAEFFIDNLLSYIQPNKDKAHLLDLACGKGRHSIYMNKLGYQVTGADLSENSISAAKVHENEKLSFVVQDMREPLNQKFSHILNMFTSFGYFDSIQDNQQVIRAIDAMSTSETVLVFDYLNAQKVRKSLVQSEQKDIKDLTFNITRKTDSNHVYKYIQVIDGDKVFNFMERVQLLQLDDFRALLRGVNFEITDTFGNFQLDPFVEELSDRLILIARKK